MKKSTESGEVWFEQKSCHIYSPRLNYGCLSVGAALASCGATSWREHIPGHPAGTSGNGGYAS
jgi:hypothetical protein